MKRGVNSSRIRGLGDVPAAQPGVPVEMVPATARQHIAGFAALNIAYAWRMGGDWHGASFGVEPSRVASRRTT